jgi:hypothetical protein
MSVERRDPAVCSSLRPREARVNDKHPSVCKTCAGEYRSRRRPTCSPVSDQELQGLGWRRWSRNGLSAPCGCSAAVGTNLLFRMSLRQDRSHKLWGEANKKAQCGKSARWV